MRRWFVWMRQRPQVGSYWCDGQWDEMAFKLDLWRWRSRKPRRSSGRYRAQNR